MSLLLDRIRQRRPKGYGMRCRTERQVPEAVLKAKAASLEFHKSRKRRLKYARYRQKSITHRPLSAITKIPNGQPSFRLGLLLANAPNYDGFSIGKDMRRDDEHAMILFKQASEVGHVGAITALGEFYQAGRGRKRGGIPPIIAGEKRATLEMDKMDASHMQRAIQHFRRAAKAGDAHAALRLAMCLEETDMWEARELYRISAKAGILDAEYNLGMLCMRLTPPDYNECREMLMRAAKHGHTGAMVNLGMMYQYGRGVHRDGTRALDFFKSAAKLGDIWAINNLGCKHAHEAMLAQKSLEWCREECAQKFGIDWEMKLEEKDLTLFDLIASNRGIETLTTNRKPGWLKITIEKVEDAVRIDQEAVQKKSSLKALQDHIQELESIVSQHRTMAVELFKKASDAGHIDSMKNLGILLGDGAESEGVDILRDSLNLSSEIQGEKFILTSPSSENTKTADITPSMTYRPSHTLAREPINHSCLGTAKDDKSIIASPYRHYNAHMSEYYDHPKTQEGLLLSSSLSSSTLSLGVGKNSVSGKLCVSEYCDKPGSPHGDAKLSAKNNSGKETLKLIKDPPAAFFWGHTGDDEKSRQMLAQSRLLRPRAHLPLSMRLNRGASTKSGRPRSSGFDTRHNVSTGKRQLSPHRLLELLDLNEDDSDNKRRSAACLLREVKSMLLERGLDASIIGVYNKFEKTRILRERLRKFATDRGENQLKRIKNAAKSMSNTMAKKKEKLGIKLCTLEKRQLQTSELSGDLIKEKSKRNIVYNI